VRSDASNAALTLQLLKWVSERQPTYEEAMEAWRTSCPRLTIWEDAIRDGLIIVANNGRANLTGQGTSQLKTASETGAASPERG
jgi:hypothetical protein